MDNKEKDFYLRLRGQIKDWFNNKAGRNQKWSEFILLAPDIFHLLYKVARDPEVPMSSKLKIGAAIAYFIAPIDLIPEAFLGPIGYLDDITVASYALNQLVGDISPEIIRRHWAGDQDILRLVKTIIVNADLMLGKGIFRKIKKLFGKK
ncbi:MAG TPA: YkvA family protein [Ignavibacteriales bacterium]|nr:YkvA family protein [Ignavibacteriales bacterium]